MDDDRSKTDTRAFASVGVCAIEIPPPCCLVIFGATGDLSRRKLMPALYRLHKNGVLPEQFCIIGTGSADLGRDGFRDAMRKAVAAGAADSFAAPAWDDLAARMYYVSFPYPPSGASFQDLGVAIADAEKRHGTGGNRLFYFAIPPSAFEPLTQGLAGAGLTAEEAGRRCSVVIEKPFGRDLESARRLTRTLHQSLAERQIFRIDHYLAKETVQSMLMFRFANAVFEPLWNRRYIDHVQITAAEMLGVEGRASYYEESGVVRDMFQNHMFQLLSLTAMEPPAAFEADRVWDEKVKVFRSLRPLTPERIADHVVIGQYDAGRSGGRDVPAYRDEPGVARDSVVPTYAALKLYVDNWRWQGVPFFLRSGKRLASRQTEIAIRFKRVPHLMFSNIMEGEIEPNVLLFRIQPGEGISLSFQTKKPGTKVCLESAIMDFSQGRERVMDAYEWVILDCIYGDRMLFQREDSVELTWQYLSPLLEALASPQGRSMLTRYSAGSQGPDGASRLPARDGRTWRPL